MGKKTLQEFITEATKIHGNMSCYNYVDFNGSKNKVQIICSIHGSFYQTPNMHISHKNGCPKCANIRNALKHLENTEIFVRKAVKKYGTRFSYIKTDYVKSNQKIKIICKIHGEFLQTPNNHLCGAGCPSCAKIKISESRRKTKQYFVDMANKKHKFAYDYLNSNYKDSQTKVAIRCPNHGLFYQTPAKHLFGNGCPNCKYSRGEQKIANYLYEEKIEYKTQYKISECKKIKPLPFDFALIDKKKNLIGLIEYQGEQHYKPMRFSKGKEKFQNIKKSDKIKQEYCEKNNIPLLIIPYTSFKSIEIEIKNFMAVVAEDNNETQRTFRKS